MYIRRAVHPSLIWYFSRRAVGLFTALSLVVYVAYTKLKLTGIALPFLPVATIGTAVAFYVGFKNNASYERLWEARKIWAEIENVCRMFGFVVANLELPDNVAAAEKRILIDRQLAWVNSLRLMLRNTQPFVDEEIGDSTQVRLVNHTGGLSDIKTTISTGLEPFLGADEIEQVSKNPNVPCAILGDQIKAVTSLREKGLSAEAGERLFGLLKECGQQQTASERINNFPFPRQYAHFSSLFVNIFIVLLPFSLLSELKTDPRNLWLVVPFSVLISWVFYTMERVGDSSENPFENGINDVPLSTICRDIEIQMKSAIGVKELPPPLPAHDYFLM